MKFQLIFIVLGILLIGSSNAQQILNQDLWKKYRSALIQIVQGQFPHLSDGLSPQKTSFHVMATPEEAAWHQDRFDLDQDFALYAIKPTATFEYTGTSSDHEVPKLYRSMVMKCNNPSAFQTFMRSPTVSYPQHGVSKSYPWRETKKTLGQFVQSTQGRPDGAVRFIVSSGISQVTTHSPWEHNTGPLVHTGSFVKEFKANNDDDLLAFDSTTDEDRGLFRRRRRRSPPPQIQTTIIKSEKFKVDFSCKGIEGITIAPGQWFDRNFIRANAGKLQEYFGGNGKLPVLPKIVWVAQNPHVVVELSESEWHHYKNVWANPNTLGMSIGGTFFRTKNFRQKMMDDDDVKPTEKEFYANEDNAAFHADEVSFTVANNDDVRVETEDAPTEDFSDLLNINEEANQDEDWGLFRRRRRRRRTPPPPPPPRVVHEKVYRVEYRSTDPRPQIIAVTGEFLP